MTEVTVVATVLNERATIDALLESLAAQTRRPDEVVIVDAGSTDGTRERLDAWSTSGRLPLRVIVAPGANISAGRNQAIASAVSPWIAATDAGVRLEPDWLARLVSALESGAPLASGFFLPEPRGAFETALAAATLPEVGDVDAGRFLPSSRSVAFPKATWAAAGGYPEWLDYSEDLVFDLRAIAAAGAGVFVPEAVAWFRPRRNLTAFARQYTLYARGDGKADLWPRRHLIRYGVYLVLGPALLVLGVGGSLAAWSALAFGLAAMLRLPVRRLVHLWRPLSLPERLAALAWLPTVLVTGDIAKMTGYPEGLLWRARNRPPEWRSRPELGRL